MKKLKIIITFLLAIGTAVFSNNVFAQWGSAVLEPVAAGNTDDYTCRSSLAIDNEGTLHLLFIQSPSLGDQDFYYTQKPMGGDWSTPEAVGDHTAQLNSPYLAVEESTGNTHVVFLQDGSLHWALRFNGNWINMTLPTPGMDNLYTPAVDVGANGYAHIALTVQTGGEYKIGYGFLNMTSPIFNFQVIWETQLGAFGSGAVPDIFVASNGAVNISYRGGGYMDYQVDVAENMSFGGTSWTIQNIPQPGYQCYSTSITSMPNDMIYLAYHGDLGWGMPAAVFFTSKSLGAPNWGPSEEASGNISGVNPKLAMEENGAAHIVFEERSGNILTGNIFYTTNQSGSWVVELLQGGGDKYEPSLVMDEAGNGSMCFEQYIGYQNSDVYYYGYVGGFGPLPELDAQLTPVNPPIQIPPGGGSFNYDILIENTGNTGGFFDGWITATLPNGQTFGPILLRSNLYLDAGDILQRDDMSQFVPANAPSGMYSYNLLVGDYPDEVVDSDSFAFEKSAGIESANHDFGWELFGFEGECAPISAPAADYKLLSAYPNPFNAQTVISFELRAASCLNLSIYDVTGREVVKLYNGFMGAGYYEIVWDAEGMGSGVYFIRLTVDGGQSTVRKVILVK